MVQHFVNAIEVGLVDIVRFHTTVHVHQIRCASVMQPINDLCAFVLLKNSVLDVYSITQHAEKVKITRVTMVANVYRPMNTAH